MSEGKDRDKDAAADLEDLAKRFQDLWRDQMAATAADPEFTEMMGKWMAAFARGEDVHATTASAILGVPLLEVTPDMRRIAKTINFGLMYGMGSFGLA